MEAHRILIMLQSLFATDICVNTDGTLFLTIPAFTSEQKKELDKVMERHLYPLMTEYSCLVERFIAGYRKLSPRHSIVRE